MKVLLISPVGELGGGAESMLYELVSVMKDKDEVEVLFMQEGELKNAIQALGVQTFLLKNAKMRNIPGVISWMFKYSKILREIQPDVILSWMSKAHMFAAIPNYLAKIPTCWWQHGVPEPPNIFDKLSSKLPANKIGSSSTIAMHAQKRLTNKPVFCSFPGSDIAKHAPNFKNRSILREQLGISDDTILLGNVGRIQSWKKQDQLIEVLDILVKREKKVKLLLVGGNLYNLDNDFENKIVQMIKEKGLDNNVITTGNQIDVAPYYDAMDIYVHAARGEPFGIVMVEAMLHGKPLIVAKSPGSVEIVENGVTGVIVDDGSNETIASQIEQMITNGNIQLLGENGRNRAIRLFSNKQMGSRIIKELEGMNKNIEHNKVVV